MKNIQPLTGDTINEILDHFTDWLSYDNIVGYDLRQIDDADGFKLVLVVDELNDDGMEERLNSERRPKLLDIPATVQIPSTALKSEGTEPHKAQVQIQKVRGYTEDALPTREAIATLAQPRVRPCPGGYLIAAEGNPIGGTLGVSLVYRGRFQILSNNHVLAANGAYVGKYCYQPTEEIQANRLATVTGFDPIIYYDSENQPSPVLNRKDVAWCDSYTNNSLASIREIGQVWTGRNRPIRVGESIKMFGGVTERVERASIVSITYRYKSEGRLGWAFWQNGIQLDRLISQSGDSGAAYVVESDNSVIALHRTSNGSSSVGAPLWD